jgi:hypothetical protein
MYREMLWMLFLDKYGGRYAYRGNEEVREINWRLKNRGQVCRIMFQKHRWMDASKTDRKDGRSAALK